MRVASIHGTLARQDSKTIIWHEFDLPPATAELRLGFRFTPARVHPYNNLLTLTLFDPSGTWRGERHSCLSKEAITLMPEWASPGYLPGPLPRGRWRLSVAAHAVLNAPDSPLRYSVTVDCATRLPFALPGSAEDSLLGPGLHWYRGNLHAHTLHSDGTLTVAGLAHISHRHGLDFVFLTDHNTVSGLAEAAMLCRDTAKILPGLELTTFHGHLLAPGVSAWIDWRIGLDGYSVEQAAQAIRAAGGLFIISHPLCEGDPGCTGCRWEYDLSPQQADGLEVWNYAWAESGNAETLAWWHRLLNEGYRLPATAGADSHSPHEWLTARPCVDVCATSLSTEAILAAIRQGHLSLTSGPRLTLRATTDGRTWTIMGDEVKAPASLRLHINWHAVPAGATLRLVGEGAVVESWDAAGSGSVEHVAARPGRWYTAELWAGATLLAMTNPIYVRR